ncbi:MAG: DUF4105 domain-containing protein [Bacteroidales bacterium]
MKQVIYKTFAILLLLYSSLSLSAQELSPEARVSLITCGPGDEIYSFFGHSALWVYDPKAGIDRIYNYGTFDFNIPNFYWEFTKGRLYYLLTVSRSAAFFQEYILEDRLVIEQELNLTESERNELFRLLEINYLPQNRHYWYDFFKDNCSTRIRDIIAEATDNRYQWPAEPENPMTFRQLLKPYVANRHGERLGMFLLLAKGADQRATRSDYMFLPDQLYVSFDQAKTADGRPLVSAVRNLYIPETDRLSETRTNWPLLIFTVWLLLSIWVSILKKTASRTVKWFDSVIYFATGATGVLLTFMWFFTEHWTCKGNYELFWLNPINLIPLILIWIPRSRKTLIWIAKTMLIINLLALISLPLWEQRVSVEAILLGLLTLTAWYRASGFGQAANHKP